MVTQSSSSKDPITSPAQLLQRLQKHDWLHDRADDFDSYRRGREDIEEIRAAARELLNGKAIYKHYVAAHNLAYYGHE